MEQVTTVPRTRTGIYFTGNMSIPTAYGPVDLGLLARALLQGITARPLNARAHAYLVWSSNRFERGPYTVQLDGTAATCDCPAGQHGTVCKHVHVSRFLAATLEESA